MNTPIHADKAESLADLAVSTSSVPTAASTSDAAIGNGAASTVEERPKWVMPADKELLSFINCTPLASSLLYDINLLPECIDNARHWAYMVTVCKHLQLALTRTRPQLAEVESERIRQDGKWGGAEHDDHHTTSEFVQLIQDYAAWARVMAGMSSTGKARRRLIQVAALAVAAVEQIDRAAAAIATKELA